MDLIVSRRVRNHPTRWSSHFHWVEQVFWCIKSQIPVWIGQVVADFNSKLPALVWVYHWFFHLISKPQVLYKLQYYHLHWIKCQISNTCAYRYINLLWILWEEWRHSEILQSEWYWSKFDSKTMVISMIVHFSGRCPPNNLVLIFILFINYPMVACIDVKYRSLYIFLRFKVC